MMHKNLLQTQPIGIYPGAASHLLLPLPANVIRKNPASTFAPGETAWQTALQQLLLGEVDGELPAEWRFFAVAAHGDIAGAATHVRSLMNSLDDNDTTNRQLCEYNLLALEPSAELYQQLQLSIDHPQLSAFVRLTAYAYGLAEQLPDCSALSAELLAWGLACQAAAAIESDKWTDAKSLLDSAVAHARSDSPLLTAILLGQAAQVAEQLNTPPALIQAELEEAIRCAQAGKLTRLLAELYSQLGMMLQRVSTVNRGALQGAIRAYQAALQTGISADSHPLLFAELQSNLALAYLAIPATSAGSSAHLRTGIAIQSLRRALDVIDSQQYPDTWARISMNLANALQYAPSSHPAENLVQAVEMYEQVLQVRTRARDPVAYAWVTFNQANALAHLGIFKPAMEKASEAYKLFHWYEQADGAEAARELVHSITEHLVKPTGEMDTAIAAEMQHGEELQHGNV